MLINHLSLTERSALRREVLASNDALIIDVVNALIWRRLIERWEQVIWKFWVLKTLRYRDLEPVWVKLFGPRPT